MNLQTCGTTPSAKWYISGHYTLHLRLQFLGPQTCSSLASVIYRFYKCVSDCVCMLCVCTHYTHLCNVFGKVSRSHLEEVARNRNQYGQEDTLTQTVRIGIGHGVTYHIL